MSEKKVLIVDFDDKSIDPLSEFLTNEGFQVFVARDGEAGLDMCKAELPNLVIMEPMLPKLHGFELCSIITNDFEPKIPVIILTKFYREEQFKIESLRSFGASAFISKPFKRQEMLSLLAELLPTDPEENGMEEIIDSEIPDTFAANSLQSIEENSVKEEIKLEKNENLEQELMESVSTLKSEPPKAEEKKDDDFGQQIDDMLKDTLSEFGLEEKPKNSPPPKPELDILDPTPAKEEPVSVEPDPEPEIVEKEEQAPVAKEPEQEYKIEEEIVLNEEEAKPIWEEKKEIQGAEDILPKIEEAPFIKKEKTAAKKAKVEAEAEPKIEVEEPEAKVEVEVEEPKIEIEKLVEEVEKVKKAEKADKADKAVKADKAEKVEKVKKAKKVEEPTPKETSEEESTEPGSIFSGFGEDFEEKKSFSMNFGKILNIFRKPTRPFLISIAVALVVLVALSYLLFGPKKADNSSLQQASMGVPAMQQPVDNDPSQGVDPQNPLSNDPDSLTNDPESDPEATIVDPTAGESVDDPPEEEEAPPPPQPKPKSTPPPFQPLVSESETEASVSSPVLGDTTPQNLTKEEEIPVETEQTSTPVEEQQAQPEPQAPPKVKQGDIVALQQVDTPPTVVNKVVPTYPSEARNKGMSGTVMVNALINENGDVIRTVVTKGIQGFGFNESCEKAVRQWKFRPAWKDGVRVKVWKIIPFQFKKPN